MASILSLRGCCIARSGSGSCSRIFVMTLGMAAQDITVYPSAYSANAIASFMPGVLRWNLPPRETLMTDWALVWTFFGIYHDRLELRIRIHKIFRRKRRLTRSLVALEMFGFLEAAVTDRALFQNHDGARNDGASPTRTHYF